MEIDKPEKKKIKKKMLNRRSLSKRSQKPPKHFELYEVGTKMHLQTNDKDDNDQTPVIYDQIPDQTPENDMKNDVHDSDAKSDDDKHDVTDETIQMQEPDLDLNGNDSFDKSAIFGDTNCNEKAKNNESAEHTEVKI